MTTVDDFLRYINDFLNPNTTDTVLTTSTIGSWEITTSTYSSELDVNGLYPGLEFETYEDIASPSSVTKPSTPPTETEPKKPEPIITTVVEKEKEIAIIPINTQNLNPIMFDFNSNFLLNDSVDFTRNELGQIGGLERTGLRGVYDTGELGPMAEILDELSRGGSYGSGFTFDGQDTLRIADSLEGFRY
jgi:hypothetical protein